MHAPARKSYLSMKVLLRHMVLFHFKSKFHANLAEGVQLVAR